jgi:hypothetical protein
VRSALREKSPDILEATDILERRWFEYKIREQYREAADNLSSKLLADLSEKHDGWWGGLLDSHPWPGSVDLELPDPRELFWSIVEKSDDSKAAEDLLYELFPDDEEEDA